jgi:integrase
VTPHVLRHTRATWLAHSRVDRWEAAGHIGASPATLEAVYQHHHPDWQKNAAEV